MLTSQCNTEPGMRRLLRKRWSEETRQVRVTVAVSLDTEGHVTDAQALQENPPELGFAAAATSLAYSLSYSNPTGAPVVVRFAVKFALRDPQHSASSKASSE
jgi:hypothetical protein